MQALLDGALPPAKVPGLTPLDKVAPLTAAAYLEIAMKNLFSQDRNPNVIVDPPKPVPEKPPPPFPVAHGVMLWDGVPPTIVLSEKAGGPQKGYHAGESIGQWKLVSVDNSFVDLEWEGKQFKKRIDELIDRTQIAEPATPRAAASKAPAPAADTASQSLSSTAKAGPGVDVGAEPKRLRRRRHVSERHGGGWHEEGGHRDPVWKLMPLGAGQVKQVKKEEGS